MLSDAMGLAYPRNRLPTLGPSILHGHYLWPGSMQNVVMLWRDGRDVIVSQYYHALVRKGRQAFNEELVRRTCRDLKFRDYLDIKRNLPEFIEYTYQDNCSPRGNWAEFVENWAARTVVHARYESLRANCASELRRIVRELSGKVISEQRAAEIADRFSFENQSGRLPGQENKGSFLRKGIVGDWKKSFSPAARRLFSQYAGQALIRLEYERDNSWI